MILGTLTNATCIRRLRPKYLESKIQAKPYTITTLGVISGFRNSYPHKLFRFILLKSQDNRPVEPMHSTASQPDVKCFFKNPASKHQRDPHKLKKKTPPYRAKHLKPNSTLHTQPPSPCEEPRILHDHYEPSSTISILANFRLPT